VRFAFDPAKDGSIARKHGVSLSEAARLDWNRVLAKLDTRTGDASIASYSSIAATRCGSFSLRKANNRMIDRYEIQINSSD
jgi:hypothetical protein